MLISKIDQSATNMHALKGPIFNYRHGGWEGEGWRVLGGNGGVSVVANIIGTLNSQDGNAKEDIDQKISFCL